MKKVFLVSATTLGFAAAAFFAIFPSANSEASTYYLTYKWEKSPFAFCDSNYTGPNVVYMAPGQVPCDCKHLYVNKGPQYRTIMGFVCPTSAPPVSE